MKIRCHNCGKPINFCRIIWNTFVINNIICKNCGDCVLKKKHRPIFLLYYILVALIFIVMAFGFCLPLWSCMVFGLIIIILTMPLYVKIMVWSEKNTK